MKKVVKVFDRNWYSVKDPFTVSDDKKLIESGGLYYSDKRKPYQSNIVVSLSTEIHKNLSIADRKRCSFKILFSIDILKKYIKNGKNLNSCIHIKCTKTRKNQQVKLSRKVKLIHMAYVWNFQPIDLLSGKTYLAFPMILFFNDIPDKIYLCSRRKRK